MKNLNLLFSLITLCLLYSGCSDEQEPTFDPAPESQVVNSNGDHDGDGVLDSQEKGEGLRWLVNGPRLNGTISLDMTYINQKGSNQTLELLFASEQVNNSFLNALNDGERASSMASGINPFARHFRMRDMALPFKLNKALMHCSEDCTELDLAIQASVVTSDTDFQKLENYQVKASLTLDGTKAVKELGIFPVDSNGENNFKIELSNGMVRSLLERKAFIALEIVDGELKKKSGEEVDFNTYKEELFENYAVVLTEEKEALDRASAFFVKPGRYNKSQMSKMTGSFGAKSFGNGKFNNSKLDLKAGQFFSLADSNLSDGYEPLCHRATGACDILFDQKKISTFNDDFISEIDLEKEEKVEYLQLNLPRTVVLSSEISNEVVSEVEGCTISKVEMVENEHLIDGLLFIAKNFQFIHEGENVTRLLQENDVIETVATDEKFFIKLDLEKIRNDLNLVGSLQLKHSGMTNYPRPLYSGGLAVEVGFFSSCEEQDLVGVIDLGDINPRHSELENSTHLGTNLDVVEKSVIEATFVISHSNDSAVERLFNNYDYFNIKLN